LKDKKEEGSHKAKSPEREKRLSVMMTQEQIIEERGKETEEELPERKNLKPKGTQEGQPRSSGQFPPGSKE